MKEGGLASWRRALPVAALEVLVALGLLGVVSVLAAAGVDLPRQVIWAGGGVLLAIGAAILHEWPDPRTTLGPANQVTLGRAVLVALVAGALAAPAWAQQHARLVAAVAGAALLLDGVDGWVARRCRCASAFGARFDMELDAFLILVLCVHLLVMGKAGSWVLAIGAMRYGFVAAMRVWPWLDGPLPESGRRKLVCVWQVASLLLCLLPVVGPGPAAPMLALALGLLAWSFAIDVRWRYVNGGPGARGAGR
jgi:phosphatidylglycerophosphate synthase